MKRLLEEYIDACGLIKETESMIKDLEKKKKTIVQASVKGSNPEFPFEEKHFHIEGISFTSGDVLQLEDEIEILEERKANAEKVKLQVEKYMNTIPMRMQRIIQMKFFENNSWEYIANRLGRKATADSVRKQFENFLKEK
ncbi:MAG: RNA polymerase subunit sigma-70 [Lachnospiraceae bacterium]|nr:RNA polymerase subunit sigma-70 [Lachnospiraceae bacterium]